MYKNRCYRKDVFVKCLKPFLCQLSKWSVNRLWQDFVSNEFVLQNGDHQNGALVAGAGQQGPGFPRGNRVGPCPRQCAATWRPAGAPRGHHPPFFSPRGSDCRCWVLSCRERKLFETGVHSPQKSSFWQTKYFLLDLVCMVGRIWGSNDFSQYLLHSWKRQKWSLSQHRCSERNAQTFLLCGLPGMWVFALLQLLKCLYKYFLEKQAFILETFTWLSWLLLFDCLLNREKKNVGNAVQVRGRWRTLLFPSERNPRLYECQDGSGARDVPRTLE